MSNRPDTVPRWLTPVFCGIAIAINTIVVLVYAGDMGIERWGGLAVSLLLVVGALLAWGVGGREQ